MKLDRIDLKILEILQENGRITNAQLATEIGLSPAPTLERVRKLENTGLIQSFHALLDAEKLGLTVIVFLEIKLSYPSKISIEAFIANVIKIPEIVEVYHVTGGADFLIKLYATSIMDYQTFLSEVLVPMDGIGNLESKVVLSTLKRENGLPLHKFSSNGTPRRKKKP